MATSVRAPLDGRWPVLLHRICERCVTLLAVDDASIGIVVGPDQLLPGVAHGRIGAELAEYAVTVGEGPQVDAVHAHATVDVVDLQADEARARWPAWAPAATEAGIRAVSAVPIEAGAITAGVLTLYATSSRPLDPRRSPAGHALLDAALLGLLDLAVAADDAVDGGEPAGRGAELDSLLRSEVHQAAGMVMVQAGLPIDEALARLRAHAFATGLGLAQVATDVVAGRLRFDDDGKPAQ